MNRLLCGANTPVLAQLEGFTVQSVRSNNSYAEALGLETDMVVEVSTDSGVSWTSVGNDYTIESGDWVRFNRSAGKKG